MEATLGNWVKHFNSLSPERQAELKAAVKTLELDPLFNQEFCNTRLFKITCLLSLLEPKATKKEVSCGTVQRLPVD